MTKPMGEEDGGQKGRVGVEGYLEVREEKDEGLKGMA